MIGCSMLAKVSCSGCDKDEPAGAEASLGPAV